MITLIIRIKPDPIQPENSKVSMEIDSENQVTYNHVISALVAITDNVIQQHQKAQNAEENNQTLEQSTNEHTQNAGHPISNSTGTSHEYQDDNGPVF